MERFEKKAASGIFRAVIPVAEAGLLFLIAFMLWFYPVRAATALRFSSFWIVFFVCRHFPGKIFHGAAAAVVLSGAACFVRIDFAAKLGLGLIFALLGASCALDAAKGNFAPHQKRDLGISAAAAFITALALFLNAETLNFIARSGMLCLAAAAAAFLSALRPQQKGKEK